MLQPIIASRFSPPSSSHHLREMASPNSTFRLLDLPPEIFEAVLSAIDNSMLAPARSVSTPFKELIDRRFYTTFFTDIESSLAQKQLENLLWLSKQSHLACRIMSLSFAIDDDYTSHFDHTLVTEVMNNLSEYGNITSLGVTSKCWNHSAVSTHCSELVQFIADHLVPHRDTIKPRSWKIVIKIDNLRVDRDMHLHNCLSDVEDFVASELSRDSDTPQGIDLEIHERACDPIRYIEMTKNSAFEALMILRNFNCEDSDTYAAPHTLNDAMFTVNWNTETLIIRDSVFLQESLIRTTHSNASLRHLVVGNVRMRRFIGNDFYIEPADWIETLQECYLESLESCRFVKLLDGNGDFFVEGVWESTAASGHSVSNAVADLINYVLRARSFGRESEPQQNLP
jgi:hypothetical protein